MPSLIGVILPSFTIGMAAYLVSSRRGLAGATMFLWIVLHATTSPPIGVYGECPAFGMSLMVSSYIALPTLYPPGNPGGREHKPECQQMSLQAREEPCSTGCGSGSRGSKPTLRV